MKEGWDYKKLGEVCDIINGKNQKAVEDPDGKYPIMGSGGVMGYANNYLCKEGTTIIGRKGTINKPIYVNCKFWNVDTAFGLQPKEETNNKFLYYLCKSINFEQYNKSVTIPSLVKSDLLKIGVHIPNLVTQESIVSELDLLSEVIEKHKAQLEELDKLAQSIFYDMFGDPVTNEKGWEIKKLKDIASKIGSGATPRGGNQSYKDEGISLIRSMNVHNNFFIYDDLAFIDDEQAAQLNNVIVESNDILLNITGASVARCCMVPDDVLPARVNQHVCIIRPIKNLANSIYLNRYFTSIEEQSVLLLLSRSNAATREALPKNLLDNCNIVLPPLSLQQEFAAKVEAIEAMKAKVRQSLKEAETLFNERMDYYFN